MSHNNTKNKSFGFALFLIGCLFFSYGFITWANSALIPYLKIACELSDTQSYLVATAFFAAYFFMAIPSSYVLRWVGFKRGMSLGLFVMAFGALIFIPAAESRSYPMFLTGLFIIGTGMALLQTASNPYAAALGPMESAARRISIMGICNKIAGVISVYVLSGIMLKDVDQLKAHLKVLPDIQRNLELDMLAQKVVLPYTIIAISLSVLGIIFFFIHLPEVKDEEVSDISPVHSRKSILRYPHLILGVLAIFFYVGVEVISYDTFTGFGEELGYPTQLASKFATYTGYGLLAGYLLSIAAIPRWISQRNALTAAVLLSMALVVAAIFTRGTMAVTCFALLGFSNAVMWPAIWPLALDKLGRFTKIGSALLVMGIVGGAVITPLYAKVSEWIHSRQQAYWLMIPCYLYILYFALKGYKFRKPG